MSSNAGSLLGLAAGTIVLASSLKLIHDELHPRHKSKPLKLPNVKIKGPTHKGRGILDL